MKWRNPSPVIHPLWWAVPMNPGGPSRMKLSLKCTRGKMDIGGRDAEQSSTNCTTQCDRLSSVIVKYSHRPLFASRRESLSSLLLLLTLITHWVVVNNVYQQFKCTQQYTKYNNRTQNLRNFACTTSLHYLLLTYCCFSAAAVLILPTILPFLINT